MTTNTSLPDVMNSLSPELTALLDKLREARGSIENWGQMEFAIMERINICTSVEHVWCRGEVHGVNRHYPAVVIMNRDTRELKVLAPSGPDFAIEEHPHHFFSSAVPHIGIVRETLAKRTNKTDI